MSKITLIFSAIICSCLIGCVHMISPTPPVELETTPIPTPSSFDDIVNYINSEIQEQQIVGMWAALGYQGETPITIPLIIHNLYDPVSEVRLNAAKVLGEFGTLADQSVPDLIIVLQRDDAVDVQVEVAMALGKIGNKKAVPPLASNLFGYKSFNLAIYSAKSISMITGEVFPDSDSRGGYRVNDQGVPLIVIAAQEWWEETGKYLEW